MSGSGEIQAVDRLYAAVESVARLDECNMSLSVSSPSGRTHAATVWFAPTTELDLITLSAPSRLHAQFADQCAEVGIPAIASGTIRPDGQKKSDPNCHGTSYEGTVIRLTDPADIEGALNRALEYRTFTEEELDKYMNHPHGHIPTHAVYKVTTNFWSLFDGRLGADCPDRLVYLSWPPRDN